MLSKYVSLLHEACILVEETNYDPKMHELLEVDSDVHAYL